MVTMVLILVGTKRGNRQELQWREEISSSSSNQLMYLQQANNLVLLSLLLHSSFQVYQIVPLAFECIVCSLCMKHNSFSDYNRLCNKQEPSLLLVVILG